MTLRLPVLAISLAFLLAACTHGNPSKDSPEPDVLMQIGDSSLTRQQVLAQIPAGISHTDSLRLFDAIVEEWVERNMLSEVATATLPDIERIDRLVEQYRRQLLAQEYRRLMAADFSPKIPDDSVRARYASRPEAYILARPAVKAIYVKLPSSSPQLADVRRWVRTGSEKAIDELETLGLNGAMEYDDFDGQWVSWDDISRRIPYRFPEGNPPPKGLFETSVQGVAYLLNIKEALPAGEPMPYDFAAASIRSEMLEESRTDRDRAMLRSIFRSAIKNGRIRTGSYTPLRYRTDNKQP